jgi:hypothetical protein
MLLGDVYSNRHAAQNCPRPIFRQPCHLWAAHFLFYSTPGNNENAIKEMIAKPPIMPIVSNLFAQTHIEVKNPVFRIAIRHAGNNSNDDMPSDCSTN